jgi:hypothetical protein
MAAAEAERVKGCRFDRMKMVSGSRNVLPRPAAERINGQLVPKNCQELPRIAQAGKSTRNFGQGNQAAILRGNKEERTENSGTR